MTKITKKIVLLSLLMVFSSYVYAEPGGEDCSSPFKHYSFVSKSEKERFVQPCFNTSGGKKLPVALKLEETVDTYYVTLDTNRFVSYRIFPYSSKLIPILLSYAVSQKLPVALYIDRNRVDEVTAASITVPAQQSGDYVTTIEIGSGSTIVFNTASGGAKKFFIPCVDNTRQRLVMNTLMASLVSRCSISVVEKQTAAANADSAVEVEKVTSLSCMP